MQVRCPGCGAMCDLGAGVQVSDMVSCASCAGVVLRLVQQDGQYVLLEVPQASCPECETRVQLPDTVRAGETLHHCGQALRVTYAYGAYALEPMGVS